MEVLLLNLLLIIGLSMATADISDNYQSGSDLRTYNTLKCIDNKQGSWSSSILHQYAGCDKKKISQKTKREFRRYRIERDMYLGKS